MAMNSLFLLFAVVSYLIMFLKYIKSRRSSMSTHQSKFFLFRTSKFYVSLLLITSFIILSVIPSLIMSSSPIDESLNNNYLYLEITSVLSDTVDGVIYVLLYAPVRTILKMKVISIYNWCTSRRLQDGASVIATQSVPHVEPNINRQPTLDTNL